MEQVKLVQMAVLPKGKYKIGVFLMKNPKIFIKKAVSMLPLENKMPKICQSFGKEEWRRPALATLKIFHTATLVKAVS